MSTFIENYDFSGKTVIPFCTPTKTDSISTSIIRKCSKIKASGRVCHKKEIALAMPVQKISLAY